MTASYIVRLDDACPTMRKETWDALEEAFDSLAIRPIVGVIPDNRDPAMLLSEPDPRFWERVRNWEQKGWSIALHGLHHRYHQIPAGAEALLPLHAKSEFVGLSLDNQREMMRKSWRIFLDNGVKPTSFMAPSHSFDRNTLLALQAETDIRVITDGYALSPYRAHDFVWAPQQLWRFRRMPFGIWTICLHPNTMRPAELNAVIGQFRKFAPHTISLEEAVTRCNQSKTFIDRLFANLLTQALNIKQNIKRNVTIQRILS
ncbi:MAG: DUF2334 domain-containing protein [Methylomonas sp.]|jgi:predicted deacetylase